MNRSTCPGRFLIDALIAFLLVLAVGVFAWHLQNKPLVEVTTQGGVEYQVPNYVRLVLYLDEAWSDSQLRIRMVPGAEITYDRIVIGRVVALDELRATIDISREAARAYPAGLRAGVPVTVVSDVFVLRGTLISVLAEAHALDELKSPPPH